jgi:heat-inducible transcriptional repressor
MNQITPRQQLILKKLIEEHIKTGKPISSSFLEKNRVFAVCSATLRIDLMELNKKGFLKKSHLSGGRVPTDKGYRFFINSLIEEERQNHYDFFEVFHRIINQEREEAKIWFAFARALSDFSQGIGLVWNTKMGFPLVGGWPEIVKWPEFNDSERLKKFTFFVENFEERLEEIPLLNEEVRVFVGKELPFKNEDFCAIVGLARGQNNQETRAAILGPKRMDFCQNIHLLDSLLEAIEEQL